MKRSIARILTTVVLAIVALQTVACGGVQVQSSNPTGNSGGKSTPTNGPIKIVVVPKAVGSNYWEQVQKGAQCAQSKLQNVTMQWDGVSAETDVTGQINLLTNYITQGVNGIVYAATDARALTETSTKAVNANIKVINIDSGTNPQPANVPLFATDNTASAVKAADLLSQALNGKGKVAFIPFQAGSSTSDQRAAGFKQGLAKHPELQLVAEQYSQSDPNTALRVTENILSAHPDITGIFAANEPGVIGAAQAVHKAGKDGKITIIGWDAAPDEVKGVQNGTISALVVQNPFRMGYDGLNAAVNAVRGKAVSSEDTGVTFVTKANLNDSKVQAVLNPSCANPPV
ncbi:ABC transporter substrate-binding protein [Dictyobacter arantiisoli]|uniref:ABC transporter substrate-binding protein n=1 Tax=Dictyobacter arantiisoli TaxID=2014874 RepID=A0A5A5TFH3_9CHLR|nr:ABC transporter substrate-binding protein [Dictyobacter arantiisoli]GCF09664.1 ABC transporter substrate-binding protein [Dictyobacter arantiisoli]